MNISIELPQNAMQSNQKNSHYQDLKEYYNCLGIIEHQENLISSVNNDLFWCSYKLQEAQKLLKSSKFSYQSINNIPEIKLSATKIYRITVENFLTSIKKNIKKLNENDKLIIDLIERQKVKATDVKFLSCELQELEKQRIQNNKIGKILTRSLFICIVAISIFIAIGLSEIATIFFFIIIIIIGFLFIFSLDITVDLRIDELKANIENNELIIHKLKLEESQKKRDIENQILKSFSQLNGYNKLARQITEETKNQLEKIFQEKLANLNQIINRIYISDYPDNRPRLLTLNWDDPLWIPRENDPSHWQPQINSFAPDIVRIGEIEIKYQDTLLRFPALVPIRDFSKQLQGSKSGHIAFYSQDANSRQTALLALQSLAFRMISSFPVRKFKGIFIDPVGMGDTFPFGNLHEFITNQKIYTRADDIREQLRGLTEHIEQVIQNYLGSNYSTIEDYNLDAGAISEPYRYLFIFDFRSTSC
ncbi:hypothetical protein ACN4EE_06435 [Geminocystis sp. CENA526]|uniref:hypothetical protein n=1 Tax=Geminocystis sp. CENA526 TaxID=1355871 RepID=UPI003D6E7F18